MSTVAPRPLKPEYQPFAAVRALIDLHTRAIAEHARRLRTDPQAPLVQSRTLCVRTLIDLLLLHTPRLVEWLISGVLPAEGVVLDALDGHVVALQRNDATNERGEPAPPPRLGGRVHISIGLARRVGGHGRSRVRAHRRGAAGRRHIVRRYDDSSVYCAFHCTATEVTCNLPDDECWLSCFFKVPAIERRRKAVRDARERASRPTSAHSLH